MEIGEQHLPARQFFALRGEWLFYLHDQLGTVNTASPSDTISPPAPTGRRSFQKVIGLPHPERDRLAHARSTPRCGRDRSYPGAVLSFMPAQCTVRRARAAIAHRYRGRNAVRSHRTERVSGFQRLAARDCKALRPLGTSRTPPGAGETRATRNGRSQRPVRQLRRRKHRSSAVAGRHPCRGVPAD